MLQERCGRYNNRSRQQIMWLAGFLRSRLIDSPHLVAITTWSRGMPFIASPAHLGRLKLVRVRSVARLHALIACCPSSPGAPPRLWATPTQQLLVVALRLSSVVQLRCVKQGDPRCQGLLDCSQALLLGHGVGAAWGTGPECFSMRLMWVSNTPQGPICTSSAPRPSTPARQASHSCTPSPQEKWHRFYAAFGALPVRLTRRKPSFLSGGTRTRGRELADPGSSSTASRTALHVYRRRSTAQLPPPEASMQSALLLLLLLPLSSVSPIRPRPMLDTSSPPILRLDNWPAMSLADVLIREGGSLQQLRAEKVRVGSGSGSGRRQRLAHALGCYGCRDHPCSFVSVQVRPSNPLRRARDGGPVSWRWQGRCCPSWLAFKDG